MKKSKSLKRMLTGTILAVSTFSLVACNSSETNSAASGGEDVTKISLYSSGSQNVETFWETVIPKFEEAHKDIDVNFVFVPSGTGGQATIDRIVAAKKANKDSEIDIYEGALADIIRSEEEGGLFYELSTDSIKNLENVQAENLEGTQNLAVPYRASSVVLAYNSDKVKDVPTTAAELNAWIEKNPGRFAYNDPNTGGAGSSFVLSTVYNELDDNAMNVQDESIMKSWDKGIQILKDMAPNLYKSGVYPKKNQGTVDLLANGEVDMIPAWSDMALEQINSKLLPDTTKLTQIDPAFTGGPAYLMAVDNGNDERKEASETFLDYVLTQDVQKLVIDTMYGYPGIKWDLLPAEDQKKFEAVSGGYRTFNGGDLASELMKVWQKEVASQ
ncbi:extracellular solute-binding protein [Niallia taxi]|uniref:Extracellular solute-binding protein n=1 Tax=Niallia taxi TaxID=2499688 RepID=A0A3S2UY61_9BACI|nr:extracellular solute-binding protein [Niallia taxi]MCM3215741.1 extracellular solute-binding protein [Niallia taxi]MDK8641798.1 extracellular solute-binding protein [Niallia taxi]MED4056719.1 extracellular solute-binding protein [Niallia taxi]MED4117366.1 extracellular solute-binding protein [Niallia taxi]RVT65585.1 extracellular solute-binding protein [Niallia taxi]